VKRRVRVAENYGPQGGNGNLVYSERWSAQGEVTEICSLLPSESLISCCSYPKLIILQRSVSPINIFLHPATYFLAVSH
jgi:hypothetical protein